MKSKKNVYFHQTEQSNNWKNQTKSFNKSMSINKNLRETSAGKHLKNQTNHLSSSRALQEKNLINQKMKVIVGKDSFLLQKKYFVNEVHCLFTKAAPLTENEEEKAKKDILTQDYNKIVPQKEQMIIIEGNTLSIWKGLVKHQFAIQKDQKMFLKVSIAGYRPLDISMQNKRVQLFDGGDETVLDETEITLIEPIKLLQEQYDIREKKISIFWSKNKNLIKKQLCLIENDEESLQESEENYDNQVLKRPPQYQKKNYRVSQNQSKLKQMTKTLEDLSNDTIFSNLNLACKNKRKSGSETDRLYEKQLEDKRYLIKQSQLSNLLKFRETKEPFSPLITSKKVTKESSFSNRQKKEREKQRYKQNLLNHNDYYMGYDGSSASHSRKVSITQKFEQEYSMNRYGLKKGNEEISSKKSFKF